MYILKNRPTLTPGKFCSIVGQPFGCKDVLILLNKKWSINIAPEPKIIPEVNQVSKT